MGRSEIETEMALQQALLTRPDDAGVHIQLSELYRRQGLSAKAVAAGRRVVELEPDQAAGWLYLGSLLFDEMGSSDEAEAALRRAIELLPDDPVGHLRLSRLLLHRGHTDEALASVRRARDLARPEGWLWSDIGVALADGNSYDEARSALDRAVEYEPEVPLHHYRLGEVLQRLGASANALTSFRRATEVGPEIAWLQSHLGYVLTEAGDFDHAQAALERAAELAPDDSLTRSRQALLRERREHAARRARRLGAARSGRDFPITTCIVLAAPRTGSTVLGQSVSEAWQTDFLGEIFHDEPENDFFQANFFKFRCTLIDADPSLSIPTLANQRTIFRAYCGHIQSISPSGASILDLKYYSWHHLNSCFVLPEEPPTLVEFVRHASWPVVHLVRENLFALYCSLKLSQKRGVWHRSSAAPSDVDRPSLLIDVDACRREMDRLRSATNIFNEWFDGYDNIHHLTYERMFAGGTFSPEVEATFTKVFDEPLTNPLAPTTQKVTPPLHEVVENLGEVLDGLRGTPFHSMALEALASGGEH